MAVDVALGVGSNLGDSERILRSALIRLGEVVEIASVAPLYRSAPVDGSAQPDYFNTVLVGTTSLAADELLAVGKRLEWLAGRRRGRRNAARALDIDLLVYGDLQLDDPELSLPHPRLRERSFALVPLARIAPDLAIPPHGERVRDLVARLPTRESVREVGWDLGPPLLSSVGPAAARSPRATDEPGEHG